MDRFVLVAGFKPFGGEKVNPSALMAQSLEGWEVAPGLRVRSVVVPVTWDGARPAMIARIEELYTSNPPRGVPVILMLGQAGGYPAIGVERVAVNICNGKDSAGVERTEEPVVPGGPASYFSTLPLQSIVERVHGLGLPAFISNSAGTYLCNSLFYGVSHYLATGWSAEQALSPRPIAGFIHLPYLPEQAVGKTPVPPSMARADIETAVRAALEAAVGAGQGRPPSTAGTPSETEGVQCPRLGAASRPVSRILS